MRFFIRYVAANFVFVIKELLQLLELRSKAIFIYLLLALQLLHLLMLGLESHNQP